MKAMVLAAGRGERMRPLTDSTPKPLLKAGGKTLIEHHLSRLTASGYSTIIINTHHLGDQIHQLLGDGSRYSARILYSDEQPMALETAGGIKKALPLLGLEPFLVINGDVWCDHCLSPPEMNQSSLAHLVLVNNPSHNPNGDFSLDKYFVNQEGSDSLTFSGIGWYRPELFEGLASGPQALAPLLRTAMARKQVSGEYYDGAWWDIGTPQRLESLDLKLKNQAPAD